MANNAQLNQEQWSYYNGIITTGATKNKNFDFRDKLQLAQQSKITMLHDKRSRIGFYLTDQSKGKGNSIVVSYNFPVDTIRALYEVAKSKLLDPIQLDTSANTECAAALDAAASQLFSVYQQVETSAIGTSLLSVGNSLNAVIQKLQQPPKANVGWEYKPDTKVNPYVTVRDNLHPVSSVWIRFTPYDGDGSPRQYPWYISVTNGLSTMVQKADGRVNYGEIVETETAFVNVSKMDMFRMLSDCVHYLDVWEQVYAPGMMVQAAQYRQQLSDWMKANR